VARPFPLNQILGRHDWPMPIKSGIIVPNYPTARSSLLLTLRDQLRT
jgi:hypothetical protein